MIEKLSTTAVEIVIHDECPSRTWRKLPNAVPLAVRARFRGCRDIGPPSTRVVTIHSAAPKGVRKEVIRHELRSSHS